MEVAYQCDVFWTLCDHDWCREFAGISRLKKVGHDFCHFDCDFLLALQILTFLKFSDVSCCGPVVRMWFKGQVTFNSMSSSPVIFASVSNSSDRIHQHEYLETKIRKTLVIMQAIYKYIEFVLFLVRFMSQVGCSRAYSWEALTMLLSWCVQVYRPTWGFSKHNATVNELLIMSGSSLFQHMCTVLTHCCRPRR